MAGVDPWEWYDKDRLPQGWAYPVGRDELARLLVSGGVTLGSLSFSAGTLRADELYVLRVHWPSDARARYFHSQGMRRDPLMMFVQAVPSSLRLPVGQALRDRWLKQAIAWAGEAPQRGNAWTASDHHWNLIYRSGTGFTIDAS
ncbi:MULTISPECIES: hypothetical protein [Terrabacteria group]|uniref:hypothetical protein n=1 Tax=Bacillati TaxID=1783272 RepID=UPI00364233F1